MKVSFVLVFTLFQVLVFSQVGTNITGNDSVPLDSFQLAIQEVSEIIALDSMDAKAYMERGDLICGAQDESYFKIIFGNEERNGNVTGKGDCGMQGRGTGKRKGEWIKVN